MWRDWGNPDQWNAVYSVCMCCMCIVSCLWSYSVEMLNAINWPMTAHCVLACFFSQSDTEFWDKMQAEWEELARRNWLDNPDNEGPIPLNVSPNESVRALQSGEDIFFLEGIFASSFDWLGFSRSCWTCYLGISCVLRVENVKTLQ